jgi:hypothetical protein
MLFLLVIIGNVYYNYNYYNYSPTYPSSVQDDNRDRMITIVITKVITIKPVDWIFISYWLKRLIEYWLKRLIEFLYHIDWKDWLNIDWKDWLNIDRIFVIRRLVKTTTTPVEKTLFQIFFHEKINAIKGSYTPLIQLVGCWKKRLVE